MKSRPLSDLFLAIGAEYNLGGIPAWLARKPGIQFRTFNKLWMTAMEAFSRKVMDMVRPFLATYEAVWYTTCQEER